MASTIKVDNVQNQPGTNIVSKCGTTVTVGAASDNIRSAGNNLQASDGGNLISQSGTDITLGASGDTINLASGASQTGFGRTGTVDWVTTPKVTGDSPITAVTGKGYFLNTTAGTITVNLPAGAAGSIVSMADYAGTWQTNNVTVSANGSEKIGGVDATATLSTEGQSVTFVYVDSTQGWVNTMDSTSNVRGAIPFMTASVSGACNTLTTVCTNYKLAKFIGPGTFCVSAAASCTTLNAVGYMVVAGGGGAHWNIGGGGGAGGFREGTTAPIVPYTASPLVAATGITVTATAYPIVVGAGGVAETPAPVTMTAGSVSTFSTICSAGGAVPAGQNGIPTPSDANGGSGGGGRHRSVSGGVGNTPPVSPAQGTPGGGGPGASNYSGGGGGGATVAGTASPNSGAPSTGGPGGTGATTSISATPTVYAGGGGGGVYGPGGGGTGGPGGGGPGGACSTAGTAATINTGGGGGGGGEGSPTGGAGGSGIVYIRYKFQ